MKSSGWFLVCCLNIGISQQFMVRCRGAHRAEVKKTEAGSSRLGRDSLFLATFSSDKKWPKIAAAELLWLEI